MPAVAENGFKYHSEIPQKKGKSDRANLEACRVHLQENLALNRN